MKKFQDILIIGFALFSTYFGAGDLMFPPIINNLKDEITKND